MMQTRVEIGRVNQVTFLFGSSRSTSSPVSFTTMCLDYNRKYTISTCPKEDETSGTFAYYSQLYNLMAYWLLPVGKCGSTPVSQYGMFLSVGYAEPQLLFRIVFAVCRYRCIHVPT